MLKSWNIKSLPILMVLTIAGIAAFQMYWLKKAYEREQKSVERQTNMLFRETVGTLQVSKLKLDRLDSSLHLSQRILIRNERPVPGKVVSQKMATMMNAMMRKAIEDSAGGSFTIKEEGPKDTILVKANFPKRNRLVQLMFDIDSIQDTIRIKEVEVAYARRLDEQNLDVPFHISRVPTVESKEPRFNEVTIGFRNPITYRLELGNTTSFLLTRILTPILFSLFLLGFTIFSFTLLYRNLIRQRKLGDIKNEFISNITHELKTPIATVSVAIEALRSFNDKMDPQRTKEYLDISANELQRLSLLVDKVLKLSMFEKKAIELKYESLCMKKMVEEVYDSMRLQFEKHHAQVSLRTEGDTTLEGDRLHLVSVVFNLMDNALKYSQGEPKIAVEVIGKENQVQLVVTDSGIGIPSEYHGRIFEKFFRVPTGNLHNAKGYGLGLSYVAHVVARHKGQISVHSVEGNGTRFTISLPRQQA